MNNREEFEKWRNLQRGEEYNELEYFAWQEATTRQQKIIDELKAENFAMSAMVCKHPDKRTLDENYDTIKDYCDMLKAENPDVPCPVCKNKREYAVIDTDIATFANCETCNNSGTVSTVKALQHEIEQLKKVNKLLQESLDDDLIKTLKAMEA